MSKCVAVTGANFEEEVLKSKTPVLLDFWASWCAPCRMVSPSLEQLAEEYSGRIKIGKVNVDEEPELSGKHGVASIPTMVLYKDGKIVNNETGALPKPKIEALFKDFA